MKWSPESNKVIRDECLHFVVYLNACPNHFFTPQVIAVVMDIFTDVDLFCDLMEASNKRRVPVYILLDEKNLSYFFNMCSELDVQNSHLSVSQMLS